MCKYAHIDSLLISVPYSELETKDLELETRGVTLVFSTSYNMESLEESVVQKWKDMDDMDASVMLDSVEEEEEGAYEKLQQTLNDLIENLKLGVKDVRVVLENSSGKIFVLNLKECSLFERRMTHFYKIKKDETKLFLCEKLGLTPEKIPQCEEGVMLKVDEPYKDETIAQRLNCFRIVDLELLYSSALSVTDSDFLDSLDAAPKYNVIRVEGQNYLFLEQKENEMVVKIDADSKASIVGSLNAELYKELRQLIDESMVSNEQEREILVKSNPGLSDFSLLVNPVHVKNSKFLENSPLKNATVFSNWSVLEAYNAQSSFAVHFTCPHFKCFLEQSELNIRDIVLDYENLKSEQGYKNTFECSFDGGLTLCTKSNLNLLSISSSSVPFVVQGESIREGNRTSHIISLDNSSVISVLLDWEAFDKVSKIFEGNGDSQKYMGSDANKKVDTFKIGWKNLLVRLNLSEAMKEVMGNEMESIEISSNNFNSSGKGEEIGGSVTMEWSMFPRIQFDSSSLDVKISSSEANLLSFRSMKGNIIWRKEGKTTVMFSNDLTDFIPSEFSGITAIFGKDSSNIRLNKSFVQNLAQQVDSADFHCDFVCQTCSFNASYSVFNALMSLLSTNSEEVQWITSAIAINDFVVSLTHNETQARFDYCWQMMKVFGITGMQNSDSNVILMDGEYCRMFVQNLSIENCDRVLMWQQIGKNLNNIDAIEISSLATALSFERLEVSHSTILKKNNVELPSDMRFVFRRFVVNPLFETWWLAMDLLNQDGSKVSDDVVVNNEGQKWAVKMKNFSALIQSRTKATEAHGCLFMSDTSLVYGDNGDESFQFSADFKDAHFYLKNNDILPTPSNYCNRQFFEQNHKRVMSVGSFDIGIMSEEQKNAAVEGPISVQLYNLQDHTIEIGVRVDSMSLLLALLINWRLDAQSIMGPSRFVVKKEEEEGVAEKEEEEEEKGKRMEDEIVPSMTSFSSMTEESDVFYAPPLIPFKNKGIDVRVYLVELMEEYKVGSKISLGWLFKSGYPTEYDWVGLYKTTR